MVPDHDCEDLPGADNSDSEASDRCHGGPFRYFFQPLHLEVLFALMPRNVTDETCYLISRCVTPLSKLYA